MPEAHQARQAVPASIFNVCPISPPSTRDKASSAPPVIRPVTETWPLAKSTNRGKGMPVYEPYLAKNQKFKSEVGRLAFLRRHATAVEEVLSNDYYF